jgi:hypothetical protein
VRPFSRLRRHGILGRVCKSSIGGSVPERVAVTLALVVLTLGVVGCGESPFEQDAREEEEHLLWLDEALREGTVSITVHGRDVPDRYIVFNNFDDVVWDEDYEAPKAWVETIYCEDMSFDVEDVYPSGDEIELRVAPSDCLDLP